MNKTLEFPSSKSPVGDVICTHCEKDEFMPAVKLSVVPDPKGIIGQYGLQVIQIFKCINCGKTWQGPK